MAKAKGAEVKLTEVVKGRGLAFFDGAKEIAIFRVRDGFHLVEVGSPGGFPLQTGQTSEQVTITT